MSEEACKEQKDNPQQLPKRLAGSRAGFTGTGLTGFTGLTGLTGPT
jgi:hypothetical protein